MVVVATARLLMALAIATSVTLPASVLGPAATYLILVNRACSVCGRCDYSAVQPGCGPYWLTSDFGGLRKTFMMMRLATAALVVDTL